jgi:hypothetical protein
MWNDMREQDDSAYDFDAVPETPAPEQPAPADSGSGVFREPILGMTPPQRLAVAIFLLAAVCIVGVLFLVVSQRIYLF